MKPQFDHSAYPRSLKSKPAAALHYTIADCRAAIQANPTSENAGYYADEINYCAMELHRRRAQG